MDLARSRPLTCPYVWQLFPKADGESASPSEHAPRCAYGVYLGDLTWAYHTGRLNHSGSYISSLMGYHV
jgi:hypothetical protein